MPRYAIFFIFLVISCSQAYIEETQDVVNIPLSTSYNNSSDGILLEWETQWDYVSTKVYRGESPYSLKVYKSDVSSSKLLDSDAVPGRDYYYQIRAYNSKDRNIGLSAVSTGYRSYRLIDLVVKPSNLQAAKDLSSDSIKFYWSGDVLDFFKIYRRKETGNSYSANSLDGFFLYDVANFDFNDNIMYIDTDVEFGATYSYRVSAVGQNANKVVSELFADDIISSTTKESPEGVVASYRDALISDSIRVTWDAKLGDEYYSVYRSTSEHGEYVLISSFISGTTFIDKSLPSTVGYYVDGVYTYPTYYYKVTSGMDSGYSDAAMGQAVAKADLFDPPNDFTMQFDSSDFSLDFTWATPDGVAGKSYSYQFAQIDDNGNTNILSLASSQSLSTTVSLAPEGSTYSSFGKYYTYEVLTVNDDIDIAGVPSKLSYTHTTLGKASITDISFESTNVVTNTSAPYTDVVVYYGDDSDSVGTIIEEWHTTTTVGYIDVTWTPYHQLEQIAHFELYRRVDGSSDEYKFIANVDGTTYRDKDFTDAELSQTYEYKVVAVNFLDAKSPHSDAVGGAKAFSKYKQSDILPAPSYVNIPAHWARKENTGILTDRFSEIKFSSSWVVGDSSLDGADKVQGRNGNSGQHLYLVWDDVAGASRYTAKVNNNNISGQASFTDTYTMVDNASGTGKTSFYEITSKSNWYGTTYSDTSEEEATFVVTPYNADDVPGESRGIVFEQVIWTE